MGEKGEEYYIVMMKLCVVLVTCDQGKGQELLPLHRMMIHGVCLHRL